MWRGVNYTKIRGFFGISSNFNTSFKVLSTGRINVLLQGQPEDSLWNCLAGHLIHHCPVLLVKITGISLNVPSWERLAEWLKWYSTHLATMRL
jgi:hypothetical protein